MTAATIRNKTENYNRREFSAKELAKFFAGFFFAGEPEEESARYVSRALGAK
jgi:hypothetical protein